MKTYFKSKSKRFFLISMLLSIICPILGTTYSMFIFTSENYRTSEMYIGNYYEIKINGEITNTINIPKGETIIDLEITSLNTKDTYYKLTYSENENISIKYIEKYYTDVYDNTNGIISNTKKISLLITNTSNENIEVSFKVASGYLHNDLGKVIPKEGYIVIEESFIMNDINIANIYVDNELVDYLDSKLNYELINYSCTNNETVSWNKETKEINISLVTLGTSCDIYFDKIDFNRVTFIGKNSSEYFLYDKVGKQNGILSNEPIVEDNALKLGGNIKHIVFEKVPAYYDFSSTQSLVARFNQDEYIGSTEQYVIGNVQTGGSGIYIYNSKVCYQAYITTTKGSTASGKYSSVCSTQTIDLNEWYTVVGTFDGKNLIVYVNGNKTTKSVATTTSYIGLSYYPMTVSTQYNGTESYGYATASFSGTISNAYVFNRVLTDTEVNNYYTGMITSTNVTNYLDKYESSVSENFKQDNIKGLNAGNKNISFDSEVTYGINFKLDNTQHDQQSFLAIMSNTESGGCAIQDRYTYYKFMCYIEENSAYSYVDSTISPVRNEWISIVATYDGNNMKIYINGKLDSTSAVTGNIGISPYDIYIFLESSQYEFDYDQYTQGYIKEAFVLKKALTAEEIYNWHNYEELDNTDAIFHYKINEKANYNQDLEYKINDLNGKYKSISCQNNKYSYNYGDNTITLPKEVQSDICTITGG